MPMLTMVCFGDLWVNKVSISFLKQLDRKNKNKTWVQLYRFGINGLIHLWLVPSAMPRMRVFHTFEHFFQETF